MSVDRLLSAYSELSDDDLVFGALAYSMYNKSMQIFANFYGVGIVPTVEAFVALSPNNDYHGNLRSLSAILFAHASKTPLDDLTISTYRACATRALSYVDGSVSFLDTVRGPKILAFRDNILYPDTSRKVTLDGHMICIWCGEEMTMKEALLNMRSGWYKLAEIDFRKAARMVAMRPLEFQACLWHWRKRTRGIKLSAQLELFSSLSRWDEIPNPVDYPPFQIGLWDKWRKQRAKSMLEQIIDVQET